MKQVKLAAVMLFVAGSSLQAGTFGKAFGGSFLGSTTSNLLFNRPKETVVVRDSAGGSSHSELRILTEENRELRRENKAVQRENDKLRRENDKLVLERDDLVEENLELKDAEKVLKAEVRELKKEVREYEKETARMKRKMGEE